MEYKMKKKLILGLTILWCTSIFSAQKIDDIEQYEIRSYKPQASGLTDLVFEARIENLTEILNKNLAIGKLVDVHFKIYWISPTQYQVDIEGLKPGFKEIREELANLIKGKLEFIIPEQFSTKFKDYTLKVEPVTDGKLIRAIDETYTMAVSEADIRFDNNGMLKSIETRAPASKITTEFFHSPKPWSNNKNVLDKTISTSIQGAALITVENAIEYKLFQNLGLPSTLSITNRSVIVVPATAKEKEKKIKQENTSHVYFSKYELNTGKAHKRIAEGR